MEIGNTVIVTPIDNPCQYDPDWRHMTAIALMDNPGSKIDMEYLEYRDDPWIKRQLDYLKAVKRGSRLNESQRNLRLANIWYQGTRVSDAKFRIEPLLLTPVSIEVIKLDIGGDMIPVDAFNAYEKLYFNIRTTDGRLSKSCQLRQYFALPSGEFNQDTPPEALWKMVGALMGYDTLTSIWLWTDAHGKIHDSNEYMIDEMWRVAQSRLFMSMFSNHVGHESMAKLLSAFTSQTKMIHDSRDSGEQGLDTTRALMAILYKSSPKIVSVAKDVDVVTATNQAIKERLDMQRAIGRQEIADAGVAAGASAIDKSIQERFKESK